MSSTIVFINAQTQETMELTVVGPGVYQQGDGKVREETLLRAGWIPEAKEKGAKTAVNIFMKGWLPILAIALFYAPSAIDYTPPEDIRRVEHAGTRKKINQPSPTYPKPRGNSQSKQGECKYGNSRQ